MKYLKRFESLEEKSIERRIYDYVIEYNDIDIEDINDCFIVVDDAIPNSVKKESFIIIKRDGWPCFWLKNISDPDNIKIYHTSEFIGHKSESNRLLDFILSNKEKLSCDLVIHYDLDNKDYQCQKWQNVCQSEVDQFESLVRSRGYDFDIDGGHGMWASKEVNVDWDEILISN